MQVDIVTALRNDRYFEETYASVTEQVGVDWRWLIQLDGVSSLKALQLCENDSRIEIDGNPRQMGAGMSRNRALERGTAPYVFALDDDDRISQPDSLSQLASALERPETRGCFGAWGETRTFERNKDLARFRARNSTGLVHRSAISDEYLLTGELPIHCGALLWRRDWLYALGGWAALVRSEDTSLVTAADSLAPSWYQNVPVYDYRSHPEQITKTTGWIREKERAFAFTSARVRALHRLFPSPTVEE